MKRFVFLLLLGVVGAYFFRLFAFEGIYLATESMAPFLDKGTHLVVNKFILHFRSPKRGEVVMFQVPQSPEKGLVKRVIAIAGDRVEIRNKEVILNGTKLQEPYIQHTRADETLTDDNMPEMTVPDGCVFVLGDNRDVSKDSRDWRSAEGKMTPFLPLSNIEGLVLIP